MKMLVVATIGLLLLAGPATAGCPDGFEIVSGSGGHDTLTGRTKKGTCFRGRGGMDRFNVEEPKLHSYTGRDPRDYWDVILDYEPGEVILVPGTVDRYYLSGCNVYWRKVGSSAWFFAGLNNQCNLPKSAVVIR